MGKTNIEWADFTFNPWEGCTKVSPGCLHCYAETRNHRFGMDNWGKGKPRRRTSESNWKLPVKWNKNVVCLHCGTFTPIHEPYCNGCSVKVGIGFYPSVRRPRVFCASLADWLDNEVPIEWLADLLKLIHATPNLDWLLLTKRPQDWRTRIEKALILANGGDPEEEDWFASHGDTFPANAFADFLNEWTGGAAPDNVWMGASIEDQKRADERLLELLKIPAKLRFVSVEPMLESIQLKIAGESCQCNLGIDNLGDRSCSWRDMDNLKSCSWARPRLHWVICGGESGPNKRRFDCDWGRDLRDQCKAAGVPFFFKQADKVQPVPEDLMIRDFPGQEIPCDL